MPKAAKSDTEDKPKREKKAPGEKKITPYQQYMKDQLPIYKADHPEAAHKEAFSAVAKQWKEADENPNKGKEAKPKAPAKSKKPAKKSEEEEETAEKDASDEVDED